MAQGSLVNEQIDAGTKFLREFEKYAPVQAAFWLKTADEGRWNLYVSSDRIDDTNVDVAYGEVLRLAGTINDPNFDPFQVKLIRMDDPLALAALDIYQRYPAKIPTRFHGTNFGGTSVEEVYVYPLPIAVAVQ